MTGRLMVRSASPATCAECTERFCLRGSAKGWGCPYGLCMGEVDRNNDCGLCTECVKTCAYDNVALFWRRSGWDRGIAELRRGLAGDRDVRPLDHLLAREPRTLGPGPGLGGYRRPQELAGIFGVRRRPVGAVARSSPASVVPAGQEQASSLSRSPLHAGQLFRTSAAALVPLGLSLWIGFALAMFSSMLTFVLQSLSDPFNWGWDLLGTAGSRWHILWSPAIPWLQVACVLVGLGLFAEDAPSVLAGMRDRPAAERCWRPCRCSRFFGLSRWYGVFLCRMNGSASPKSRSRAETSCPPETARLAPGRDARSCSARCPAAGPALSGPPHRPLCRADARTRLQGSAPE